jgi:hypothetical protein
MTIRKAVIAVVATLWLIMAGAQGRQMPPAGAAQAVAPAGAQVGTIELVRAEANLSPAAKAYLESAFADLGGWQNWIAADAAGDWSVGELVRVRGSLAGAIGALNGLGLDGRALLSGYRFGRHDGEYVDDRPYRLAAVNHGEQIITLADFAFGDGSGFTLYHELGHVIDQRLGRRLSARFHELIGSGGEADGVENGDGTADGYWLRAQSRTNPLEATADAFAVWVIVGSNGHDGPVFRDTPETTSYTGIARALQAAMLHAAAESPK